MKRTYRVFLSIQGVPIRKKCFFSLGNSIRTPDKSLHVFGVRTGRICPHAVWMG